jgi:hypothetical protein
MTGFLSTDPRLDSRSQKTLPKYESPSIEDLVSALPAVSVDGEPVAERGEGFAEWVVEHADDGFTLRRSERDRGELELHGSPDEPGGRDRDWRSLREQSVGDARGVLGSQGYAVEAKHGFEDTP